MEKWYRICSLQKSTLQAFEAKYIIKNNVIPMYILYVEKTNMMSRFP